MPTSGRRFAKALALDGDDVRAFFGLSTVYRRRGDNQQTVDVRSAP